MRARFFAGKLKPWGREGRGFGEFASQLLAGNLLYS